MCAEQQLSIVSLASFDNFEGSQTPLRTRLVTAHRWVELANALGTSVVQVPSNDEKGASGDEMVVVDELRALSDVGDRGRAPVSFAYEALAWGTHVADWEESLRVVEMVDRSNLVSVLTSTICWRGCGRTHAPSQVVGPVARLR